jgi:hypothetical protein
MTAAEHHRDRHHGSGHVYLSDVAASVFAAPPRLGNVRQVLIDGPAGSGKTTYAAALAAELGHVTVMPMDDLYEGWAGLGSEVFTRLENQVLSPLRDGHAARYQRYEWNAGAFDAWVDIASTGVLVLEGVGAAAQPVDPWAVLRVWVEAPRELRLARGLERDGEARQGEWLRWDEQEAAHFAADATRGRADVLVDGTVALLVPPR